MSSTQYTPRDIERFYAKVSKTPTERGCLEWLSRCRLGYGMFKIGGKYMRAHRIAWELARSDIPAGMRVCHHCDNRSCVNVEHLFLGTDADNLRDMREKGRDSTPPIFNGEQNHKAKVTNEQALEMRSEKFVGWKRSEIARHFGISAVMVGNILRHKNWRHLDGDEHFPVQHGRARGEKSGMAKLTEAQVLEIRSGKFSGWTYSEIAAHFGVSRGLIGHIIRRKIWTHI
jgi:hypothetical protein